MNSRQTVSFVVALTVILALTTWLQMMRERTYPLEARDHQVLYITNAGLIQKAALSFDALLADVYWIRAIQHFGAERLQPKSTARFELLFPLLDITTSLDPRFSQAYRFGAIFLSEPYPGGAGRPDLAIKLLDKGIRADPDRWWYYHDAGFVAYWHLRDYQAAAEWFRRGSTRTGAPWWLTTYAAVMLTRGGDRQTSRFMWEQLASATDDDWLRQTSRMRIMQLDAMDQIEALEQIVKQFARSRGRLPTAWEEVAADGLLRGVPIDPSGTPYTLNFANGGVTIAPWSNLSPLPDEAVRLKPNTTY